jgi:2-keto-3-deoxy-L-arabinonate dehydratase
MHPDLPLTDSRAAATAAPPGPPQPAFWGIYPMQYAFFGHDGRLDRGAMRRQVQGCIGAGAHGLAVLGLGTEVNKLSEAERRALVDWVTEDVAGRVPVAVTVAGASVEEQAALAAHARAAGAAWIILQPPPERGMPESHYAQFFARVIERTDLPVAIQNAPEYIGVGLSDRALLQLASTQPNFVLLKGEGPVLTVRRSIEALAGALAVFNGRGGLELPDNLRAGCAGMIPATDTFDYQVRVFERMRSGDADEAERIYREVLPAMVFVMQSLDTLICYGKRIAAWRLGLDVVYDRAPRLAPDPFGLACAQRYAASLGPLP